MLPQKDSILSVLGIVIQEKDSDSKALCQSPSTSIEELYASGVLPVTATMPVDERTMHPFGKLSGGASLALAESLAGYASHLFCQENEFPVGLQVSANHISSGSKGEMLTASARLVHKGRKTHIWNIDVYNEYAKLISSVRVTNMIIPQ